MNTCHCEFVGPLSSRAKRGDLVAATGLLRRLRLLAMTTASMFMFLGGSAWGNTELSLQKGFDSANKVYREGKFPQAARAYQKLVSDGFTSSCLFYNLGNAYVKMGELGKAVVSYERALRENPRDPEAKANLDYVRNLLSDKSEEGGVWALVAKVAPAKWLSWHENVWGFMFFYWIGAVVGILGVLIPRGKKGILIGSASLLCIALLLGAALFFRSSLWAEPQAIVMAKEAEVRYGPVMGESTAFTLHEGSKVRVLRSTGDWVQILFAKGKVGWLPLETVEII